MEAAPEEHSLVAHGPVGRSLGSQVEAQAFGPEGSRLCCPVSHWEVDMEDSRAHDLAEARPDGTANIPVRDLAEVRQDGVLDNRRCVPGVVLQDVQEADRLDEPPMPTVVAR